MKEISIDNITSEYLDKIQAIFGSILILQLTIFKNKHTKVFTNHKNKHIIN